MALQSLPPSAEAYAASNTVEIGAAVAAVERVWSRMDPADFDASYLEAVEPTLLAVLDTAQERVSTAATAYVPQVMADLGLPLPSPAYRLKPAALVGTTGDGLTTEGLAYRAVIGAKRAVSGGMDPAAALAQSGRFLTSATGTLLSDTGRAAERVAAGARRVDVFVRMLVPPSCGRCVILAGRVSGRRDAFQRHPRCDCRNVPATESIANDLTTNPGDYLDSLDDDALARTLGSKANAQAYRMGADRNQLVNAYRGGVRQAQVYGRNIKYTTEGTTRSGLAYTRMRSSGMTGETARRGETVTRITRTGPEARTVVRNVAQAPRLMPETIFQIATDPADAQRLLRQYGWIVDDAPRTARAVISAPVRTNFVRVAGVPDSVASKYTVSNTIDVLGGANPRYAAGGPGYGYNCGNSVTAYELRSRGLAVSALPVDEAVIRQGGIQVTDFLNAWRTPTGAVPELSRVGGVNGVRDALKAWPDDSRGFLVVGFKGGSGHVLMVERVKGVTRYVDAQSGEVLDAATLFRRVRPRSAWMVRSDDLTATDAVADMVGAGS